MIKATEIEKSYNGERVLKGVSLHIARGEFVSIMGESGSGKSTLLSILGGHLAQDKGTVLWNERDISKMNEREIASLRCTDMGFVFQSYQLIPTLNVKDNLLLPVTLSKNTGKDTQEYLDYLTKTLRSEEHTS